MSEWRHFINLTDLVHIISSTQANFGVAHDGDADRILAIDEKGQVISGDQLLALFTRYILSLKNNRGKPVVTTVSASLLIDKIAEQFDSTVERVRVGDVFVSSRVKEIDAAFGGEPSGPYIFPKMQYCPDGPLSAAILISILENETKSLNELISEFPVYPMKRENLPCPASKKLNIMKLKLKITSL